MREQKLDLLEVLVSVIDQIPNVSKPFITRGEQHRRELAIKREQKQNEITKPYGKRL